MALDPCVHQHVAGASIETLHGAGIQIGDIGDATDVHDDAMNLFMRKHGLMKCRNQRSPLAAGRDIPAAEVAHNDIPGQFGE